MNEAFDTHGRLLSSSSTSTFMMPRGATVHEPKRPPYPLLNYGNEGHERLRGSEVWTIAFCQGQESESRHCIPGEPSTHSLTVVVPNPTRLRGDYRSFWSTLAARRIRRRWCTRNSPLGCVIEETHTRGPSDIYSRCTHTPGCAKASAMRSKAV